jgi:hypothetical protein
MNQMFLIVLLALMGLLCLIVGGMSLKKCKLASILLMIMGIACVAQSGYLGFKKAPASVAAAVQQ